MNKEKSKYLPPEIEVIVFECDDVITTSTPMPDDNLDEDW